MLAESKLKPKHNMKILHGWYTEFHVITRFNWDMKLHVTYSMCVYMSCDDIYTTTTLGLFVIRWLRKLVLGSLSAWGGGLNQTQALYR